MYKIYINEKPFIICSEEEFPNINTNSYLVIKQNDSLLFNEDFLHQLNTENGLVLVSNTPEKSFQKFQKSLKIMEAAGGLILNSERNKVLFIFRREKWDLPKGKIDEGESIKKAAWREVQEECGISSHQIEDHLCDTYHVYFHKNNWILKKTYWYLMVAEEEKLTPQIEEDITLAEWIPITEIIDRIKLKTYPMILEILDNMNN